MPGEKDTHLGVRVTQARHLLYRKISDQLGMTMSDLLLSALDVVARVGTSRQGWECRRVYLVGTEIVEIGDRGPDTEGIPLPAICIPVVAPRVFWDHLERTLPARP